MKYSCHFFFNHLGMLTLQNSTHFSNTNSVARNKLWLYIRSTNLTENTSRARMRVHWPVTQH
jgi:hypothetical protein